MGAKKKLKKDINQVDEEIINKILVKYLPESIHLAICCQVFRHKVVLRYPLPENVLQGNLCVWSKDGVFKHFLTTERNYPIAALAWNPTDANEVILYFYIDNFK